MKGLIIVTGTIFGILGIWWFFPTESDFCHRYLDGRYSQKKAVSKWTLWAKDMEVNLV